MRDALTPSVMRELLNIRNMTVKEFASKCGFSAGYGHLLLMKHRIPPEHIYERMKQELEPIMDTEFELAQELALLRSLYHRNLLRASQNRKNNQKIRGRPFKE